MFSILSAVRRGRILNYRLPSRNYSIIQCPPRHFLNQLNKSHLALLNVQSEFINVNSCELYSTVGSKSSSMALKKILRALSSGVVSLPFENFNRFRPNLLKNYQINIDDGFEILKSCSRLVDRSPEERIEMVDQVFKQLLEIDHKPNKNRLIALVQAYRQAGNKSFEDYRMFFKQFSCPIDIDIYEELMYLACQNDDSMTNALNMLNDLKSDGFEPTERIYSALIMGYSKQSIEAMENVLKEMETNKISPSEYTFTELIKGYIRNAANEKAIKQFSQTNDFTTDQLYDIIRTATKYQNEEIIIRALELLPDSIRNAKLIAPELQNICIEALYVNDKHPIDPYKLIIRHLPVPDFENENSCEYGRFLLKEMIAKGECILKILELCTNLSKSDRNKRSIHFCCEIALKTESLISEDLLKSLADRESLRPHYFWPLIVQAKNNEEILKIVRFAIQLNTMLDVETFLTYVLPRLPTLLDPQQILKSLTDAGVRMAVLKTAFIVYLVKYNKLEEALDIATRSQASVDPFLISNVFKIPIGNRAFNMKNAWLMASILKKLQLKSFEENYDMAGQIAKATTLWDVKTDFENTKKLLKAYSQVGVKISRNSAAVITQKIEKNRYVYNYIKPIVDGLISDELFPEMHEKQKTQNMHSQIESLELQFIELKANGFPTHGVLHRLFSKYVQLKRFNDAKNVLNTCKEMNVIETSVFLSQCLQMYTAIQEIDNAFEAFNKLKTIYPYFVIDEFKLIDFASLLIKEDRFNEAIDVLKTIKANKRNGIYENLVNNVYRILDAAREYGVRNKTNENMAEKILNILLEKQVCKSSTINLGHIVKEYIEKKDMHAAVASHAKSAELFNETPQMVTLTTELLKIGNATDETNEFNLSKTDARKYLQKIIEISCSVHGTERANVNVILSFAHSGNDEQLRKIMLDPTIKFDEKHLLKALNYFKSERRIDIVVAIIRSARGTAHTLFSPEKMFGLFLSHFVRENDPKSALQFYDDLLKTYGENIPKETAKALAEFLKSNNENVPKELQQYIQ